MAATVATVIALALALVGCATSSAASPDDPAQWLQSEPAATAPADERTVTTPQEADPAGPSAAEELLATLTLEQKVGQLFMPVVWGDDASAVTETDGRRNIDVFGYRTPAEIVDAYHLGGIMYLGHNIVDATQVGSLSAELQRAALADTGIGLLVAVDQEGGRVNRITDGVTVFPPAALLSGDQAAVEEAGYLTGRQVSAQGVNVVLAPVADLAEPGTSGAIGNRSYGSDPAVVADMVTAAISGLQGSGVAAAVKHWPGHGATEVDSHVSLPELTISETVWIDRERFPFEAAIASDVAIVLVGHLALPAIDPSSTPATISPILIDQELRGELGFDGVVMTDALNMGAVSTIDPGDLVVEAVAAGADVMLYPPDLPTAYDALIAAVSSGRLEVALLDAAVLRVLELKDALGLLAPPSVPSPS